MASYEKMFNTVVSYVAGTNVVRNYDIGEQVASAGLWKIYAGTKKTTGQKMFEKKIIENPLRKGYERKESERVYQVLKREASQLARLRHPSLLEIAEPVDESRTAITFATEPILASLTNLLGNYDNLSPIPEDIKKFEMDELEIQKGLLQVGKGLQFCHNDAKIIHANLVPEAIFVNAKGDWKIGGFGFSTSLSSPDLASSAYEYPDYDSRIPFYAQKNLDYMAPEYALDETIDFANDMYALGCLIYAVHNHGMPPLKHHNSLHTFKKNMERLSSLSMDSLPYHLQDVMTSLLTRFPSQRLTAEQFQTSKYFDNILVSTVKFLESFPEKTADDKANFMKGLIRILPQFPERVLVRKIMTCLLQELKDHSLLPFILPNIFFIVQKMTQDEFMTRVLPSFKFVFTVHEPMQNMITLLDNIKLLQQKTTLVTFKEDVMPLVYHALETKSPQIQEKVLKIIPTICESLDYTTVKSSLFSRIQNLFAHTTILAIKVQTLICFHALLKVLDKFTMTEKLIPLLKNIKTKEPTVVMATLTVFEEMSKFVDKDIMATEILPQLWKLSVGPTLNLSQFQRYMKVIKDMAAKVEEQHARQLADIKSLETRTKDFLEGGNEKSADNNTIPVDFEKLVGSSVNFTSHSSNNTSKTLNEIIPDPFNSPLNHKLKTPSPDPFNSPLDQKLQIPPPDPFNSLLSQKLPMNVLSNSSVATPFPPIGSQSSNRPNSSGTSLNQQNKISDSNRQSTGVNYTGGILQPVPWNANNKTNTNGNNSSTSTTGRKDYSNFDPFAESF
ncbi:2089_t:CDS:10 [Paraglomus occultum]|uniref:2089_t:CDS:1 n=1 Tax=Paraglomus occultum TaxID=144539 RepID=A0A9N9B659_9GLOM|nr:2089_t:CDS:10 [Paraglomus occultum]